MLAGSRVLTRERATSCLPLRAPLAAPELPPGPRTQLAPTRVRFRAQPLTGICKGSNGRAVCSLSFLVRLAPHPFSLVLQEKEIKYPIHHRELSPATFEAMTLGVPSGTEI